MKNQTLRKTIAGLVLGGALLAVPVLADVNTDGTWTTGDEKTTVNYSVTPTYTVVIPATLTVSTIGTYDGATNNVFINSNSTIAATDKITVTLPVQDFEAKLSTTSTVPFTVKYTTKIGTNTASTIDPGVDKITTSAVTLLEQTGAEIAGTVNEDGASPTTGQPEISAGVQATVTAAQAAQADIAGAHVGAITFAVAKS